MSASTDRAASPGMSRVSRARAAAIAAIFVSAGSAVACVKIPADVGLTFAQVSPRESEFTHYQRKRKAPYPMRFLESLDAAADADANGADADLPTVIVPGPHDAFARPATSAPAPASPVDGGSS